MFAQLLLILPLVNLFAVPILAFVGENRSRKNFFRALLMWLVPIAGFHFVLLFTVFASPSIFHWFKDLWVMILDVTPMEK